MRISNWSSDVCSSDLIGDPVCRLMDPKISNISNIFHNLRWHESSVSCGVWRGARQTYAVLCRRTSAPEIRREKSEMSRHSLAHVGNIRAFKVRSEERRVGKECVSECHDRRRT